MVRNSLAETRRRRGLSAAALAERIGVSRQTVYAMEHGTYVPNTTVALRLSAALAVRVEDLFHLDAEQREEQQVQVELLPGDPPPASGQPVQLCRVGGRLISSTLTSTNWSFPAVDAVFTKDECVQLFEPGEAFEGRLLVAGCDPGISVLGRHIRKAGVELVVAHRNSSQALELLKQSWVHIAGTHLPETNTGQTNAQSVTKLFRPNEVAVITFAVWEQGLVTAKENPKGIKSVQDLGRKEVRVINREEGAGSRVLLDSEMQRVGLAAAAVNGYESFALGHIPAVSEVKAGRADCCIATRAAARMLGLNFIPLANERYDFVIRTEDLNLPSMEILLETLERSAFRRELELLGGYETRSSGTRIS